VQDRFAEALEGEDTGLDARLPMAVGAFEMTLDNPLGIGEGRYNPVVAEYYRFLFQMAGAEDAVKQSSHNQFLNIMVYYGVAGLLLLLLFYAKIFQGLKQVRRETKDPLLRATAIGLTGGFAAYIVNSLFHNDGPFLGDIFNWFFIGLALALLNICGKQEIVETPQSVLSGVSPTCPE
jgi:O-antigen ligase